MLFNRSEDFVGYGFVPSIYIGNFTINQVADTFIRLDNWSKVCLELHCLPPGYRVLSVNVGVVFSLHLGSRRSERV